MKIRLMTWLCRYPWYYRHLQRKLVKAFNKPYKLKILPPSKQGFLVKPLSHNQITRDE